MDINEFPIGSSVRIIKGIDDFPSHKLGSIGRIVSVGHNSNNEVLCGVEFDFNDDTFHDAHGHGKDKYCFYFLPENIEIINNVDTKKYNFVDVSSIVDNVDAKKNNVDAKDAPSSVKSDDDKYKAWR